MWRKHLPPPHYPHKIKVFRLIIAVATCALYSSEPEFCDWPEPGGAGVYGLSGLEYVHNRFLHYNCVPCPYLGPQVTNGQAVYGCELDCN